MASECVEEYHGVRYSALIEDVHGRGFTALAVIWRNAGEPFVLEEVLGSIDVLLETRYKAARVARGLAEHWIDDHPRSLAGGQA